MNILVYGNGSLSVASQEHKLCVEFAKKGHKVYLVCDTKRKLFDVGFLASHENLEIIHMSYGEYQIDNLMIEDKIDVCLGMDQSVAPFVAEYRNRTKIKSYCMFLDFPVHVLDSNDPINYNFSYAQRYYYWITCGLELDGVIFNTSVAVEEFWKRYKRKAYLVWYSVSDDSVYDVLSKDQPSKDYVFGCDRLIPYKGIYYTINAIKKLGYEYKHVFVSGDKKVIESVSEMCQKCDNIMTFFERADEFKKMKLFYNAKLITYPQITKWLGGLAPIEGMGVKTPSVCFDYPTLRELYSDCVLYARPKSIIDFRQKIQMLYEDEDMNKELAEKGHKRFKKYFTKEVMINNLLNIFEGN